MRRFNEEIHTIAVAIMSKTGDHEYDISREASFGCLVAEYNNFPLSGISFFPVDAVSEILVTDKCPNGRISNQKLSCKCVNVFNRMRPDWRL
jgi:hypothetical protein